jgi:hypothetical protein
MKNRESNLSPSAAIVNFRPLGHPGKVGCPDFLSRVQVVAASRTALERHDITVNDKAAILEIGAGKGKKTKDRLVFE